MAIVAITKLKWYKKTKKKQHLFQNGVHMPVPVNVIEIRRLLGAISFYWCYFRDFASKVAPMCKLLKKMKNLNGMKLAINLKNG